MALKKITSYATMKPKDAVYASLAQCFVSINGSRYNFMQATELEAKFEKNKVDVAILGRTGKGHKSVGWTGTGSAKFRYNTSLFRKLLEKYKDTGIDTYFDIRVTNEDPSSAAGRQTIILKGCNLDGAILAKFQAGDELLEDSMDFTFEDFVIVEGFTELEGFLAN